MLVYTLLSVYLSVCMYVCMYIFIYVYIIIFSSSVLHYLLYIHYSFYLATIDAIQYHYQILSHPTRKMRDISNIVVSTLLRCRRLLKWWKVYIYIYICLNLLPAAYTYTQDKYNILLNCMYMIAIYRSKMSSKAYENKMEMLRCMEKRSDSI